MFGIERSDKCPARFSTIVALLLITFVIISIIPVSLFTAFTSIHVLLIRSPGPLEHTTSSKFLSVALDSSMIIDNFSNFNMRNKKLRNMIKNLSPGYLRIGGTMADRIKFTRGNLQELKANSNQNQVICTFGKEQCVSLNQNYVLSDKQWLELYNLTVNTGFTILFDLNSLIRNSDGSWNDKNAEEMIKFSNDNNMDVIWQLGNEPNAYQYIFNYTVSPSQLVKDFAKLRRILNKYPVYKDKMLVGPDITNPAPEDTQSIAYLQGFLASDGGEVVSAITFHQYYFNGKLATQDDFLLPDIYNKLIAQIEIVKGIVSLYKTKTNTIWLSETADAYGGGAAGYSNRYISTFIWLDKLGMAAKLGLDVVVRQTLFKGFYALIDNNYEPTPNYWLSVLYKTFVGPEVVSCTIASSRKVRLYCQCSRKDFKVSSVTLFGFNIGQVDSLIRVEGLKDSRQTLDTIYSYVLSSYASLYSKNVYLNGELLMLDPNGHLPHFKPILIDNDVHVVIPAYSSAFFVIPTDLDACQ